MPVRGRIVACRSVDPGFTADFGISDRFPGGTHRRCYRSLRHGHRRVHAPSLRIRSLPHCDESRWLRWGGGQLSGTLQTGRCRRDGPQAGDRYLALAPDAHPKGLAVEASQGCANCIEFGSASGIEGIQDGRILEFYGLLGRVGVERPLFSAPIATDLAHSCLESVELRLEGRTDLFEIRHFLPCGSSVDGHAARSWNPVPVVFRQDSIETTFGFFSSCFETSTVSTPSLKLALTSSDVSAGMRKLRVKLP